MKEFIAKDLERAVEINKEIKEYEKAIAVLKEELRTFKQPKPEYSYKVVEVEQDAWCKIPGAIRIVGTLDNQQEFDLFLDSVGFMMNPPKELIRSVTYFRTAEHILAHDGGGYLLLKDCCLCTDEEWEEIKKGNFSKFRNENI